MEFLGMKKAQAGSACASFGSLDEGVFTNDDSKKVLRKVKSLVKTM
jgi:hypothetical protein